MPIAIVKPDEKSPRYGNSDAAADAISKDFGQTPEKEQAAVIFERPDGQHVYSTVAPQDSHDDFALRAQMPKGWKLSGIVHSHPGEDNAAALFSPKDIDVAHQLNVPSYVRFLKDDSIRKYVPGSTVRQQYRASGGGASPLTDGHVSRGDPLSLPAASPTSAAPAAPDDATPAPPAAPSNGGLLFQAAAQASP